MAFSKNERTALIVGGVGVAGVLGYLAWKNYSSGAALAAPVAGPTGIGATSTGTGGAASGVTPGSTTNTGTISTSAPDLGSILQQAQALIGGAGTSVASVAPLNIPPLTVGTTTPPPVSGGTSPPPPPHASTPPSNSNPLGLSPEVPGGNWAKTSSGLVWIGSGAAPIGARTETGATFGGYSSAALQASAIGYGGEGGADNTHGAENAGQTGSAGTGPGKEAIDRAVATAGGMIAPGFGMFEHAVQTTLDDTGMTALSTQNRSINPAAYRDMQSGDAAGASDSGNAGESTAGEGRGTGGGSGTGEGGSERGGGYSG